MTGAQKQTTFLWVSIRDALTREIRQGEMAPGSRIPSDNVLAERFGVNRHTVRRALSDLTEEGLIRSMRGRGTFVTDAPISYSLGPLSRFTENLLKNNFKASRSILHAETVLADESVAHHLGIKAGELVLTTAHLGNADGTAISIANAYYPESRTKGLLPAFHREKSITKALRAIGVDDYERKWTKISARMPTKAEKNLLGMHDFEPVLVNENVDVNKQGLAIKYTNTTIVAARLEFFLDFSELKT